MGRLILQEQIERGMLMKFLSIFSARRDASGKTRIAPVTNKINVEEAVRLFGVSSDELTPAVRAAFAAMTGEITLHLARCRCLARRQHIAERREVRGVRRGPGARGIRSDA